MKTEEFADFAGTSGGRRAATLLASHAVKPQQIFAKVHAEVFQILPYLEEGVRYLTKNVLDPDIWAEWTTAEKRVAGMCLAYMVRTGAVPLYRHFTPSGKGPAKYRTTPPTEPVAAPIKIVRARRRRIVQHAVC